MSSDEVTEVSEDQGMFGLNEYKRISKTVNGLILPSLFPDENVENAMRFRPHDKDLIVATYPKCGTTWTQYIVCNLLHFEEYGESSTLANPVELCPFIDYKGIGSLKPGDFHKTHLPFDANRFNPRAKYIIVFRNPRDVCVSFYHHTNLIIPGMHGKPDGFWFPEYAELFISNRTWYGDYFEHVLGWLDGPRAAGASEENVLYVIYEKMKANPREELIRIANFIGGQAAERAKDDKIVDEILARTGIRAMKKDLNPKMSQMIKANMAPEKAALVPDSVEFVRKGQIGDWKNYFTPEISAAFDAWINADPRNARVMELFEQ